MDRQFAYTGAIPQTRDILSAEKNTMNALGYALQAFLGPCTSAIVDGLALAATTPASLSVTVGVGSIYSSQVVDQTAYGDLGTDTAHTIVKQGLLLDPVTLTVTPPATSGYSQNYLVQVAYSDVDGGSLVLPYYNAANPSVPFAGPNNAGTSNYTVRQGKLIVQLKAGTAATTGSQTTPSPDAGYTGLYVITVANGATSVNSSNFRTVTGAPFIPIKLPALRQAIRSQADNYIATVGGTANALTATLTPTPANRAELIGAPITLLIATTNTAAATLDIGFGAIAIKRPNGADTIAGDLLAGQLVTVRDNGTYYVIASAMSAVAGQSQVYSIPGTYTFVVPAGVTLLKNARVWGAGGGGAGSSGSGNAGSGGAGASYCEGPISVVPGQSITITVGAKGAGGAGGGSPQNGGNGGVSSVGSFLTTSVALGGVVGGSVVPPGGTATGGAFQFKGREGGSALNFGTGLIGGFGGGAYGGGDTPFGVNGGVPGLGPGAGGSGGANGNAGGSGQNGQVILEW